MLTTLGVGFLILGFLPSTANIACRIIINRRIFRQYCGRLARRIVLYRILSILLAYEIGLIQIDAFCRILKLLFISELYYFNNYFEIITF